MTEQPQTAPERREATAKEYGVYRAKDRIEIDGALAFLPGDPVPVGHVEGCDHPVFDQYGRFTGETEFRVAVSKDQVEKVATKTEAAKSAANKEG